MLASLADQVPNKGKWLYEIKWDGYRAIAFCKNDQVNLVSRNNKSFNNKFYPLVLALQKLQLHAVLDGEIVVLKKTGAANFESLQNWRSEADGILAYYVFDLLWLDGYDLTQVPLRIRKELLKKLVLNDQSIKLSKYFKGDASTILEAAKKLDLEGIMAKEAESLYYPSKRVNAWLKIKAGKRQEVIIGGYTINEKSPKLFSSILVGVFKNEKLQYRGKIGTGFNARMQKDLMRQFKPLIVKESPFHIVPNVNKPSRFRPNPPYAKAVWLTPKLVCEASYTEMTSDGVMRHPSFKGMREDKEAKQVQDELPVKACAVNLAISLEPLKNDERKTLLNPSEDRQVKNINGHELKFTNLKKVFWPKEGYTKRDLVNYYFQMAPFILPYLKGRPQTLNRFPHGIKGPSFYQKDVTLTAPEWMAKFPYRTSEGEDKNFLVVQDEADLLWMANLGAIEMNPWNSTVKKPDNPTWCIIDIDPTTKNSFDQVIETALATKQVLDDLGIEGYCKTSGADGMHIYIPLAAVYTYGQCQLFGRLVASQVHQILPEFTSVERYTIKRKGKIYIDFLQNRPKATLAAPYSLRPRPGATVSMPLYWSEVKKGLLPQDFTIKNAVERVRQDGDLFKPVLGKGCNLVHLIKKLTDSV